MIMVLNVIWKCLYDNKVLIGVMLGVKVDVFFFVVEIMLCKM